LIEHDLFENRCPLFRIMLSAPFAAWRHIGPARADT
jgi:hypothetical protein